MLAGPGSINRLHNLREMMKKTSGVPRRAIAVAFLGGCIVLFGLAALFLLSREPRYQGLTATEWFAKVKRHEIDLKRMEIVFEHLGPDAISYIMVEPTSILHSITINQVRFSEWMPAAVRVFLQSAPNGDFVTEQGEVFGIIGPESLEHLQEWIQSPNPMHREACICGLGSLIRRGRHVEEGLSLLKKGLADGDARVRWRSARTLSRLGPSAKGAVANLIELLDDDEVGRTPGETIWTRAAAADALGRIGESASAAGPKLVELTEDKHLHTAFRALVAYIRISPHDEETANLIIQMWPQLDDEQRAKTVALVKGLRVSISVGERAVLRNVPGSADSLLQQVERNRAEESNSDVIRE